MATEAQIEANRRNAAKSTGPRSEEGKEKSSRNATKFGLFTRELLLPHEKEAELGALRDDVRARLKPADGLEELYVERIVAASWRLQRACAGEADIVRKCAKLTGLRCCEVFGETDSMRDLHQHQKHIASLERSIDKALAELSKLQKLRKESSGDENEPNSDATVTTTQEVSAAAPIEIVKTNPIQREVNENSEEGNREIEPNSPHSAPGNPGGGAFPAPTPDRIDPAVGLRPSASMQDGRCG